MSQVTTKLLCQNLKKIARLESSLSAKTDFLNPPYTKLNGLWRNVGIYSWNVGTIDDTSYR